MEVDQGTGSQGRGSQGVNRHQSSFRTKNISLEFPAVSVFLLALLLAHRDDSRGDRGEGNRTKRGFKSTREKWNLRKEHG